MLNKVPIYWVTSSSLWGFKSIAPIQRNSYILEYRQYKRISQFRLWRCFKIGELTEVMSKQEDYEFISILFKIWIGVVDNKVEKLLLSKFVATDNPLHPKHAVCIFAENSLAADHIDLLLNTIEWKTISISATDDIPCEAQRLDKQIDTTRAKKIDDNGNSVSWKVSL